MAGSYEPMWLSGGCVIMAKQVWQAVDGKIFNEEEQADTHDIVCEFTTLIDKAYRSHGGIHSGFTPISEDEIKAVADVLVNTDVFGKLVDYAKSKELI